MTLLNRLSHRTGPLLAAFGALALLILALMPAEKTLGQVIKIVYLHGALSRAGMIGLIGGGVAGAAYLILRRLRLAAWSTALLLSGWLFWTVHFIVSMPATRLTWGPWIAWGEPRVTMTLQIIAAGLAVYTVDRLLSTPLFSAAANTALGATVLLLAERTGVFRHPLDPIGSSPSDLLRLVYGLLLVPLIAGMFVLAWRFTFARALVCEPAGPEPRSDRVEA